MRPAPISRTLIRVSSPAYSPRRLQSPVPLLSVIGGQADWDDSKDEWKEKEEVKTPKPRRAKEEDESYSEYPVPVAPRFAGQPRDTSSRQATDLESSLSLRSTT